MKKTATLLCMIFVANSQLIFAKPTGKFSGGIIFIDLHGEVKVKNVSTEQFLEKNDVQIGKSIHEGYLISSSEDGRVVLLFTNGSTITLSGEAQLNVSEFKQEPFKPKPQAIVGDLEKEPSHSKTKLNLDYGELVFNIKPLSNGSAFIMESPVGTVRIHGTAGQISLSVDENGNISGGVNVVEGSVNFTDASGNTIPVPAGQSTIAEVDVNGLQVGETQVLDLPFATSQEIIQVAKLSSELATEVSLENVSNAAEDVNISFYAANANEESENSNEEIEGSTQEQTQNPQQTMGELVQASAYGAANGVVFTTAVSGQPANVLASIATAAVNGFSEGIADSALAEGSALNEMLNSIERDSGSTDGVLAVAQAYSEMALSLDLPTGDLIGTMNDYANGTVDVAVLAGALSETINVLPGTDELFNSLLATFISPSRNLATLASLTEQITDLLKPIIPEVDLMVAMAIQGAINGALDGAESAGITGQDLASIQQGAQDLSQFTITALSGINLAEVLAGASFDQLLEQIDEVPAIDLDDPLLVDTETAFSQTSDPPFFDSDKDGLTDQAEQIYGTDPNNPDTDGDLLKDGAEVDIYGSSPLNNDTDNDGVSDSVEVGLGQDPTISTPYGADSDYDGLPDEQEAIIGTNPLSQDSDADGWWDSFEIGVGSGFLASDANNPLVRNTRIDATAFTVSPVGKDKAQNWLPRFVFTPE